MINKIETIFVFIGSLTGGGAERVAVSLSENLSDEFDVTVVTLGSKERDFYHLSESVNRVAMGLDGKTSGINKIFSNTYRVYKFRRLLKKEKPDLVIAFMTRYAVIGLIASFLLNNKVIVSERNYPPKRANHGMWELLRKYVYKYADLHIVQTPLIADWIEKNTHTDRVKIIPNSINWPIPVNDPILSPEKYLNNSDKLILAAGTFKHQKGFDLLLESANDFLRNKPNWKLVILGDDKEENAALTQTLKEKIECYGLKESVIMPGRAGNIGEWYKRADIFVLSSRYEGFPNVLLEAMASGCACVSFNCKTGPSEMITHLENGILVPECDVETMSDQVIHLIDNPEIRKSMGEKATQVRDCFSEKYIMQHWKEEVKRVLSN